METAEKIAAFDDRFITSSVADACELANHDDTDELSDVLAARCENAVSLVDEYFDALRNRS